MPQTLVGRERLLDPIASDRSVARWIIQAGAGYGKTVLLEQLRDLDEIDAVLVRSRAVGHDAEQFWGAVVREIDRHGTKQSIDADLGPVASVLAEQNLWLLVDEVEHLAPQIVHDLASLAHTGHQPIVLAGRTIPESLIQQPGWKSINHDALAFTSDEVHQVVAGLGLDSDAATMAVQLTACWPLAVAHLVDQVGRAESGAAALRDLALRDGLPKRLLSRSLDDLDPSESTAAELVAKLPFFDEEIAKSLGHPELVSRLAFSGVPLVHRVDGWIEVHPAFRGALRRGDNEITVPHVVVEYLLERGEVEAAIRCGLNCGDRTLAANTLAGLNRSQEATLTPETVAAFVTKLGQAARANPRCLFLAARIHAAAGRMADGESYIVEAVESFAKIDSELLLPAHVETLLDYGVWSAYDGELDRARALLERCKGPVDALDQSRLRAQHHELAGLVLQTEGTVEALVEAREHLSASLAIWRQLGEPRHAAVTTFRLTAGVLQALGRRSEALAVLEDLVEVGPMTAMDSARRTLYASSLLPYLGRASEVASMTDEVRRAATTLGQSWLADWAVISETLAAAALGDTARVIELAARFEDSSGQVANDVTTALLWSDLALAACRAGLPAIASSAYERAARTQGVPQWNLDLTAASIEARFGDPQKALEALQTLCAGGEIEYSEQWRVPLLRACCCSRKGDQAVADTQLLEMSELAAAYGEPGLASFVETRLLKQIQTASLEETPTVRIEVLGGFAVLRAGSPVLVPGGQVALLIKRLVLGSGRLVIDQLIDALWPDASLDLGRRRLRNVLTRTREACGDIIERHGEAVAMSPTVTCDLWDAQAAAAKALLPDADQPAIELALSLYKPMLLPDDRYEDWAEQARLEQENTCARLARLHVC